MGAICILRASFGKVEVVCCLQWPAGGGEEHAPMCAWTVTHSCDKSARPGLHARDLNQKVHVTKRKKGGVLGVCLTEWVVHMCAREREWKQGYKQAGIQAKDRACESR